MQRLCSRCFLFRDCEICQYFCFLGWQKWQNNGRLFAVYLTFISTVNSKELLWITKSNWAKYRINKPFIMDYKKIQKVKKPFGKDEVTGSNPVISSKKCRLNRHFFFFCVAFCVAFLKFPLKILMIFSDTDSRIRSSYILNYFSNFSE